MNKQTEPSATITKPDGASFDIQFICGRCRRRSIFTNDFIRSPNGQDSTKSMACLDCGYGQFAVIGVEK